MVWHEGGDIDDFRCCLKVQDCPISVLFWRTGLELLDGFLVKVGGAEQVFKTHSQSSDSRGNLGNAGEPKGRGARSVALFWRIGIRLIHR